MNTFREGGGSGATSRKIQIMDNNSGRTSKKKLSVQKIIAVEHAKKSSVKNSSA